MLDFVIENWAAWKIDIEFLVVIVGVVQFIWRQSVRILNRQLGFRSKRRLIRRGTVGLENGLEYLVAKG